MHNILLYIHIVNYTIHNSTAKNIYNLPHKDVIYFITINLSTIVYFTMNYTYIDIITLYKEGKGQYFLYYILLSSSLLPLHNTNKSEGEFIAYF